MSIENKSASNNKEDQDWLDTLAGKRVKDADPEMVEETQHLREALLYRHYEQTLKEQPDSVLQGMLTQLHEEGHVKTLPEPTILERIKNALRDFWQTCLTQPLIPLATAMLVMLLHTPWYYMVAVDNSQLGENSNIIPITETYVAKSANSVLREVSRLQPLQAAGQLAHDLNKIGIKSHIQLRDNYWVLQLTLPDTLTQTQKQHFAQLLANQNDIPPLSNQYDLPLQVEIAFFPLKQGQAIKTYHYYSSTPQDDATRIVNEYKAVDVTVKQQQTKSMVKLDFLFPEVLSKEIQELVQYSPPVMFQLSLLKPKYRQLALIIEYKK